MSGFALIKEKTTSKARIKIYTELGSNCLVPLSNLKYGVVLAPLITLDSEFLIKICIHFLKLLPKPNFFNTHIKKEWLMESKAFSISTVINNPSVSKKLVILRTSDISLPLSLINLLLTYARSEIGLQLRSEIGLLFLMNLLSLFFFSIDFITACFWEVLHSPTIKDCWIEAKKGSLITW